MTAYYREKRRYSPISFTVIRNADYAASAAPDNLLNSTGFRGRPSKCQVVI